MEKKRAMRKKVRKNKFIETETLGQLWEKAMKDPNSEIFVLHLPTDRFLRASAYRQNHENLRRKMGVYGDYENTVRGYWVPSKGIVALYQIHRPYMGMVDPSGFLFDKVATKLRVSRKVKHDVVMK
jgi:hypothetical protein